MWDLIGYTQFMNNTNGPNYNSNNTPGGCLVGCFALVVIVGIIGFIWFAIEYNVFSTAGL